MHHKYLAEWQTLTEQALHFYPNIKGSGYTQHFPVIFINEDKF